MADTYKRVREIAQKNNNPMNDIDQLISQYVSIKP